MREGRFEDVAERMTKKGKMRQGKQERLRVQRQTGRGREREEVFLSEQAATSEGKREGEERGEPQTSWQITFPRNRVRSSSLMQRHQGNGWCGADMLPWLVVLV